MNARGKHAHPWVQPIVVDKKGRHEETVWLGARASTGIYLSSVNDWSVSSVPRSHFDEWLSGPFTKTVRRASYDQILKVIEWARRESVPWLDLAEGDSTALALPPMRYDELPKCVARLQVSGTDLSRDSRGWHDFEMSRLRAGWPPVDMFVDGTLSTGKATAQAAHGLWMWMLDVLDTHGIDAAREWVATGAPASLTLCRAEDLDQAIRQARPWQGPYVVRDAGLTEVNAGTLTAVATSSNPGAPKKVNHA